MKRIVSVVAAAVIAVILSIGVSAAEQKDFSEIYSEYYDAAGVGEIGGNLDEETVKVLEKIGADPKNINSEGLSAEKIFKEIWERIKNSFTSPVSSLAVVFFAIVICSAFSAFGKTSVSETADFAAAVCICSAAAVPFCSAIASAVEMIKVCSAFMAAFIPVFCGILLSLGNAAFSASVNALTFGAAEAVSALASTVAAPVSGMYVALSVASAFSHDLRLSGLVAAVKRAVLWALGIAMTVFSSLLCITGAVNSSADSLSARTAKFFLSNSVPVVGGAMTDAVGTVAGCLSVLKSGVGAYGMCAVILLILPSLVQLLLWKGSFSLMSAAAGIFGRERCRELLCGLSEGAGLFLSVIVSAALLFTICLAVMIMGGGNF